MLATCCLALARGRSMPVESMFHRYLYTLFVYIVIIVKVSCSLCVTIRWYLCVTVSLQSVTSSTFVSSFYIAACFLWVFRSVFISTKWQLLDWRWKLALKRVCDRSCEVHCLCLYRDVAASQASFHPVCIYMLRAMLSTDCFCCCCRCRGFHSTVGQVKIHICCCVLGLAAHWVLLAVAASGVCRIIFYCGSDSIPFFQIFQFRFG